MKRLLIILSLTFAPLPALADDGTVRDRIISVLRDDGFNEVRISRTLLGRLRFVAENEDGRREIVVNPSNGVILRDYVRSFPEFEDAGSDGGGPSGGNGTGGGGGGGIGDDDDDHDDDGDDDDRDDDDDDGDGDGDGDDDDDDDDGDDDDGDSGSDDDDDDD